MLAACPGRVALGLPRGNKEPKARDSRNEGVPHMPSRRNLAYCWPLSGASRSPRPSPPNRWQPARDAPPDASRRAERCRRRRATARARAGTPSTDRHDADRRPRSGPARLGDDASDRRWQAVARRSHRAVGGTGPPPGVARRPPRRPHGSTPGRRLWCGSRTAFAGVVGALGQFGSAIGMPVTAERQVGNVWVLSVPDRPECRSAGGVRDPCRRTRT